MLNIIAKGSKMKAIQRYPVDNAAIMFSSIMGSKSNFRFRVSATLTELVDPTLLGRALARTIKRFPYFHVRLKMSRFNFFMEELDKEIEPAPDPVYPFPPIGWDDPLMRIFYRDRTIILEMIHVLGDGHGALIFLKTLLAQYFIEQGVDVPATHGILDVSEKYSLDEIEDSYHKYARRQVPIAWKNSFAYQPAGPEMETGKMAVTTGIIDLASLLDKSRGKNISITEYLAALIMRSIYLFQQSHVSGRQLPVRLFISSNLRRFYPSNTMRNFSYFCSPWIDPNHGDYTLDEILNQVHHQCRIMFTEKMQNALISRNVGIEKNILMRSTPLFLKKPLLASMFNLFGVHNISMLFTNIGEIILPQAIRDKVERFDTMADQVGKIKIICGAMSYANKVTINFTRTIDPPFLEDCFFDMLRKDGVHALVEKNI